MKTTIKFNLLLWLCIPLIGLAQVPTSYDADGDGIPDSVDECMYVKGTTAFKGCPFEKKITASDKDGDGVLNAEDVCPDLFGTQQNHGCPPMGSDISSSLKNGGGESSAVASTRASLFTTSSSSEQTEINDFKDKVQVLIADSKNDFADVRSGHYPGTRDTFKTKVCLPGAIDCFVGAGERKFYYANFGNYNTGTAAGEKADEIKRKLLLSLGENEWHYSLLGKAGYVEEYQVWKKTTSTKYSRIRTYIQKDNDHYNVYLTIEEI